MHIKCSNCGKHYDYEKDEICPSCGEYTKPNSRRITIEPSVRTSREQKNRSSRLKRENLEYSSYNKNEYNEPSGRNRNFNEGRSRLSLKTIFSFIIGAAVLITGISDVFSTDDIDYEEPSYEEVVEDTVSENAENEEYFYDVAQTPVGNFQINSVAELDQEATEEDLKIIAVELEYESTYNDRPEEQDWEYLSDIVLEYNDEYDDVYTSYSYNISDYVEDDYYAQLDYFDVYEVDSYDYFSGVMYFEVPQNVQQFELVIETVDCVQDEETTRRFVSEYYYDV